jgi:hypothetical protein
MIICYHKARKKFYVIKDNTKAGRKFLFTSPSYDECANWVLARGNFPHPARSSLTALGCTDPTPSDASSDASRGAPAILGAAPIYGHPTPTRQREEDE